MKARHLMTPDPFSVTLSDSVRRAADVMRELNIGAVPVVEDADSPVLRGIITDRDIATRCTSEGHAPVCLVRDHMTATPLTTVELDDDVEVVLEKMERAQVRRVPVVDSSGMLLGIIAQADLATKFGHRAPQKIEELLEFVSAPSIPLG